jgi:hypothetical protein
MRHPQRPPFLSNPRGRPPVILVFRDGTFDVSRHRENADIMVVRAANEGEIERVWPRARPRYKPGRQFPWRAYMPHYILERAVKERLYGVDYADLADAVAEDPDRALLVAKVRKAMSEQGEPAPRRLALAEG